MQKLLNVGAFLLGLGIYYIIRCLIMKFKNKKVC